MDKPRTHRRRKRKKAWSFIAGRKGRNRVRVYERSGYDIVVDYRDERGQRVRESLGHNDRDRAQEQAEETAEKLRRGELHREVPLTLFEITKRYLEERTPTKSPAAQKHDGRAIALLLRSFGGTRLPENLTRRDWDGYIKARETGELRPDGAKRQEVRPRVIEQDLKLCRAIFKWAVESRLLPRDPFVGFKVPKEKNPARPRLTDEQYESVRLAAAAVSPQMECFVVVAWHTGHRAASIRQLRWGDVDLEAATVHWRPEHDKIGYDHTNPLSAEAVVALKRERARVGVANPAAWIFPSARDPKKALSGDAVFNLWKRIASKAALPKGERYGWHSLRRAFANRHRTAPLRDQKDLGGWKTIRTLVEVYQAPDQDAQRRVLESAQSPAEAALVTQQRAQGNGQE